MQLPHSKVRMAYIEKIKHIESELKTATSGKKDTALLTQVQSQLDSLAEKYQYDEEIGSARYKLYELQGLIHYFKGSDEEALDFINQAIETRGENYARAEKLKTRLLEKASASSGTHGQGSHKLSDSERDIIDARQAVQSAGLWPIVSGIVLLFLSLPMALITMIGDTFSGMLLLLWTVIFAASLYLIYSGLKLNKLASSDSVLKKLLITNITIGILTIWSIFPIFILVSSFIALRKIKLFDGKFDQAMHKYAEIEQRVQKYRNANSIFFYRSPVAVAILTVVTFNFYALYWAYKHWALIGKSNDEKTRPVLSAIFLIFTIYPLMKRIRNGAMSHGYDKFRSAGWAATGFIILIYLSNAIAKVETNTTEEVFAYILFSIVVSAGAGLIMMKVQNAANAHTAAVIGDKKSLNKTYTGERIMIVIGIIIAILSIYFSFSYIGDTNELLPNTQADAAYQRMETLGDAYDDCTSQLEARRDSVNLYDDYEVDSFNSDLEQCESIGSELDDAIEEYKGLSGVDET